MSQVNEINDPQYTILFEPLPVKQKVKRIPKVKVVNPVQDTVGVSTADTLAVELYIDQGIPTIYIPANEIPDNSTNIQNQIQEHQRQIQEHQRQIQELQLRLICQTTDTIINTVTPIDNTLVCPMNIFQKHAAQILIRQNDENRLWEQSPLADLKNLHADYAGKAAELMYEEMCRYGLMDVLYDGDKNIKQSGGPYDILVNSKRDELKAGRALKGNTSQHDGLKQHGSDQWVFIDSFATHFYITILPNFDLTLPHPLLKKKATSCKGGYKFDLSEKQILELMHVGNSIKIDSATNMQNVIDFIKKFH